MPVQELTDRDDVTRPATPAGSREVLSRLHGELLRKVSAAGSKPELLAALAIAIPRCRPTDAIYYLQRNAQGQLVEAVRLHPTQAQDAITRLEPTLASACKAACRQGALEVRPHGAGQTIVAAPVVLQGRDPEAICFLFSGPDPDTLGLLAQLAACHLVLWHVLAASRLSHESAAASAALIELLDAMHSAPDLRAAGFALVANLRTYLHCTRAAVGLRSGGEGRCRLLAISGLSRFDPRSTTTAALEAALDEAILRDDAAIWPTADSQERPWGLAHTHLGTLDGAKSVVCFPLRGARDEAVGAVVLLDDSSDNVERHLRFLKAAGPTLAGALALAVRSEGGPLAKAGRTCRRVGRLWRAKLMILAVAAAAASMALPLTYRLPCDCQLEPATRRFVAAPFEGALEKSLVKPGDIVQAGETLARMDGREIRWKQASAEADRNQSAKKRDAARAAHNYAEMQIAELEVERLDLELRLLNHRAENLDIKTPVAGIVVSGDLERAQGAPLVVGQSLFEIAPLDRMVFEVAVHDADVSLVREGQRVTVRLDAWPGQTWDAAVTKIHPRSEIRDEQNVFIAELELANPEGRLSPGMKGRATIETDERRLGWILFHKPWEYVVKEAAAWMRL